MMDKEQNKRRAELVRKKHFDDAGINEEEQKELNILQIQIDEEINKKLEPMIKHLKQFLDEKG